MAAKYIYFAGSIRAVLVAEVTQVSLGVGYEIGRAVAMNKTILCLYRPTQSDKKLSAMIRGAENGDTIKVIDYCEDQLESILKEYFEHSNV